MTIQPILNVPLLRKVMEHIEAHPEEHDQAYWQSDCGTTMCFGGHAAIISGAHFTGTHYVQTLDGVEWLCKEYAEEILGLTGDEANALFYDSKTLDDVRTYVTGLMERAERPTLPSRAEVNA